ncbi:hypothetical protein BDF20DRAFT_836107 [Mycotypha africana]|uniref:uncharacterized protein n=1 Tax=Mycotypha africana TaxID=64632 RepID=UPI0023008CE6|nr:uncharacterized protein BDF20DRAFT_836107 [Mycotypha africana]KAI8977289.1 hypothetical protein BDF20DRAFT_836107 [Mycotypha africana]
MKNLRFWNRSIILTLPVNKYGCQKRTVYRLPIECRNRRRRCTQSACSTTTALQNILSNTKWIIRIKNGTFRIETGIKTLSDILSFVTPIPPFLSPFNSGIGSNDSGYFDEADVNGQLYQGLVLTFGSGPYNRPYIARFLTWLLGTKRMKEFSSSLLPCELVLDHRPIIEKLLSIYFNCQNSYKPLVHESTFRANYDKTDDPLNDFVCMAYDICVDLEKEWNMSIRERPDMNSWEAASNSTEKGFHLQNPNNDDPCDDIQQVIYTRHTVMIIGLRRMMGYIANESLDERCQYSTVKYSEDEPASAKQYSMALNWIFPLYNHPFVFHFMIEAVIQERGCSLPNEFRLCNDITNFDAFTFMQFQLFQVMLYSSLLQPNALRSDNEQLLPYVQQHSLDQSLKSCRSMLYIINYIGRKEVTTKCTVSLRKILYKLCNARDLLFDAIDILILLALSPNRHIAKEARRHQVPIESSPLLAFINTLGTGERFNIDYYDNYPQPWVAMMYDASHVFATAQ